MRTEDYEEILDSIQMIGIYVIRADNYQILYFNKRVREVAPNIEKGMVCHEIWEGTCGNCPLRTIGDKKESRSINYDDPFGKVVNIAATRILWKGEIPAFVMTVSPHVEMVQNKEIVQSLGEADFGIYVIDLQSGVMEVVRAAEEVRALAESGQWHWDEILDKINLWYVHPDYQENFCGRFTLSSLREAWRGGQKKLEMVYQRKVDGSYRYVLAAARFFEHEDEEQKGYAVVTLQDADERIRREIARGENDRRMAAIIRSRYDVMTTVSLDTGACERVRFREDAEGRSGTGSYEEYVQEAVDTRVYEEDREIYRRSMDLQNLRARARESEEFAEDVVQYRMLRKGAVRWYEAHIMYVGQGAGRVVNILGRDVTQEKKEEEKAERDAKERAYIVNSLSRMYFATYYVDLDTNIFRMVTQRDEVGEYLGDMQNYMEGITAYANHFIHPEDRAEYLDKFGYPKLRETMRDHPIVAYEYRRIHNLPDGSFVTDCWVRATAVRSESVNGNPKTALYVAQDITESKEREEREHKTLREACEAANHANASKTEFLSRMSHDIRTPMNAIIGMTAIAEKHLEEPERVADCLGKITVASRHLLSLINEVLDMSKIESGKIELAEEDFRLQELVDNLLTIVRPAMQKKNHAFRLDLSGVQHEDLSGDVMRLQQVFTNILENAVKYTPPGGEISMTVAERPAARGEHEYGCYEFIFQDNGIGMTKEFLARIFEPFARAEDSDVNKTEGTGLGMTIAQNIVRRMNGNIRVESEPGKGSRFTVTVFLKQRNRQDWPDQKETPGAKPGAGQIPAGRRILLAEDNELNREIAEEIIGELGVEVESACNGREALEHFENAEEGYYDMIFMDIQMPVMDGYQAARAIRALNRPDAEAVPIVAMTANAFTEDVIASKRAGMDEHIPKPLSVEKLKECILRWIGK